MSNSEISVVVPTYRRRTRCHGPSTALERQTVGPATAFEVMVVDDPVEDDRRQWPGARRGAAPSRDPPAHREARGVSAARNAGWRAAAARLVMFLGDDILARRAARGASGLAREARRQGRWEYSARSVGAEMSSPVHALARPRHPVRLPVSPGRRGDVGPLLHGEHLASRAILEQVDGFDEERFPFLYEDLDSASAWTGEASGCSTTGPRRGEHLHRTTSRMAPPNGGGGPAERHWVAATPDMPA